MSQHAFPQPLHGLLSLTTSARALLPGLALLSCVAMACSSGETSGGAGGSDSGGGSVPEDPPPAGFDSGSMVDGAPGPGDAGDPGGGSDGASPGTDAEAPGDDTTGPGGADAAGGEDAATADDAGSGGPDSGGGLVNCGQEEIALEVGLIPPTILVLIDRSGSMYDRWGTTVSSVRSMIEATAGQVTMGLMMFPSQRSCTTTTDPQVPIGPDGAGRIVAAMETAGTGGSTPMGPATEAAKNYLLGYDAPGEVAMVLVADGKPTDTCMQQCATCACDDLDGCTICGGTGASNCHTFTTEGTCPRNGCAWSGGACYSYGAELIECSHREVEIPIRELALHGIRTWIVGFAGGFGETNLLRRLATAGGTVSDAPNGFFDAGEGAALGSILSSIQSQMSACRARVTIPPGYSFPSVKVNGETVPRDTSHANGWDWVAEGELSLYGEACTAAQAEGARVEVSFLCKN